MKKAKMLFTAITVLAVVGGALAFKAKKSVPVIFTTAVSGACPNSVAGDFVTTTTVPTVFYTTVSGANCTATARVSIEQ